MEKLNHKTNKSSKAKTKPRRNNVTNKSTVKTCVEKSKCSDENGVGDVGGHDVESKPHKDLSNGTSDASDGSESLNGMVKTRQHVRDKAVKVKEEVKDVKKRIENHLITDYFPKLSRRRVTSKALAAHQDKMIRYHIESRSDPDESVIVKEIEPKGKGVVAVMPIPRGAFICEYAGDLINLKDAKLRELDYESSKAGCYMYYFRWADTVWCVDATRPNGRIGRLINHSRKSPNCKTRLFVVNGEPHLIFIALRDIEVDEELLYDYGERDRCAIEAHPWLKTT